METQVQQRQVAYIVSIKDLLSGSYVKEEGWIPNHVNISDKKVSRVNMIGVVIGNEAGEGMQNITFDDGTGKISVRNFEKRIDVSVGDTVIIVGRIRQYGTEKYLTPEIMKKVDGRWSPVWRLLALKGTVATEPEEEEISITEDIIEEPKTKIENILSRIRDLDSGDGVSYEDVVKIAGDEKAISNLLMQGEIFEIRPGKIKVLD